jgi:hypothetical protein
MDDSFNLARHVARFVALLMRSPDAVDQQKLELRTLVLLTKEGTVRLSVRQGQLVANGLAVPQVLTGVRDLADQMTGHGIESIEIAQDMAPGELLQVGRIVVEPLETEQKKVHDRLRALATTTVIVTLTETAPDAVVSAAPADDEPRPGTPERIPFVLARAARGGDGQPLAPQFDEVAFAVEQATREGQTARALTVFRQMVDAEATAADAESRRQFVLNARRLMKPAVLGPIARLLVTAPERADDALTVLARCGTDGADALIDQVARAATAEERATFVRAVDRISSGDEALVAMLADARPHMARVAAELIAERHPPELDKALADVLAGADPRVRRAAVRALRAYDTPFAVDAIARVIDDPVVEVRLEAVSALGAKRAPRIADIIGRAMDTEREPEVQVGLINALGRLGTAEAVARLSKVAAAQGGIFASRRDATMRVAAARALAEARTPGALSTLTALTNDKEREVRDVAVRALGR